MLVYTLNIFQKSVYISTTLRNLRVILGSFFIKKVQLNSYCPIFFQMGTISISFSHSYTLHDVTM